MAADNDLTPYAYADVHEMEGGYRSGKNWAGSTLRTDVLVQLDTEGDRGIQRLHLFQSPEVYEPRSLEEYRQWDGSEIRSPVVQKLAEIDGSAERRFQEFLRWGVRAYPSEHTLVIVWGHGQGWVGDVDSADPVSSRYLSLEGVQNLGWRSDRPFGGVAFDDVGGGALSIPAISRVLRQISSELGRPVDAYLSDACLMQMLEVITEIGASARFVIGSAHIQTYLGLPYRRLLYEMNSGRMGKTDSRSRRPVRTDDEAYWLARMIPDLMKSSLDPDSEAIQSFTSSSLSSDELEALLLPELGELSLALESYLTEDPLRRMDLQFVIQNTPSFAGGAQDLNVFLGLLDFLVHEERVQTGGLSRAAARLRATVVETAHTLERTVISYAFGRRYGVDEQTRIVSFIPRAVSLWLPAGAAEYHRRLSDFSSSRFYRVTGWSRWLGKLYEDSSSAARRP